jgi:hypothetical protein
LRDEGNWRAIVLGAGLCPLAVAQRIRTRREVRAKYPIDLTPEHYAYVASLREEAGGTLKDALGGIIDAHRGDV